MKKLIIRYADKTRTIFREFRIDCPQIKNCKSKLEELDLCDELARLHKRSNEEIMGWNILG